jgi:hypothetical protein
MPAIAMNLRMSTWSTKAKLRSSGLTRSGCTAVADSLGGTSVALQNFCAYAKDAY